MSIYPESSVQMKACSSQASSCFPGMILSTASGLDGREGMHCLTFPRAFSGRHEPAASNHCPQHSARGCRDCWMEKRSCHPTCLQDRIKPCLRSHIRAGSAESTFSALAGLSQAGGQTPTAKPLPRKTCRLCPVPATALLVGICRLQRDGCAQLCQSVSISELPIAERQMTCYIFSYLLTIPT